ncbi:MAG: (d)CMP kinase [Clostridiales bacterium]|nr:(d)CMP kinase [Clostridiales bacterium]
MIISIDGPAGSGKSTVAEILSKRLGFIHFNSGSLYRAVTAYLMDKKVDISDISTDSPTFDFDINVQMQDNHQVVIVNGTDYSTRLRDNNISILTPKVSSNRSIRKLIDDCQRRFCREHNVVIEGRDIGSFVFPDAEYKFYLDCDVNVRAKRRLKEELEKNSKITLKDVENQLKQRDLADKNKKIAPLVIPNGAFIIDSSHLNTDEVVDKMLEHIQI